MADHEGIAGLPSTRTATYYRNLYKERLNVRELAASDAEFAKYLHNGTIDFRDPAAVMQLTVSLLRRDFGLVVALPPDRLCPPVPNRHAYVQWVATLLGSTGYSEDVLGADIGTGASCIYPLLACAQQPAWRMVATDIDAASLVSARANVARNKGLEPRIRVVARTRDDALVPVGDTDQEDEEERLTFVMTNPPFYASADEMAAAAAAKAQPPHSACTGAPVEMIYEGADDAAEGETAGEVAFVGRLISESTRLRTRVAWYTAMVGKLSSLSVLIARLRHADVGVDNYAVGALVTGSKTRRWVLGWSYGAARPTVVVARGAVAAGAGGIERHLLPAVTEVDIYKGTTGVSASSLGATLDRTLQGLELLSWTWDANALQGSGQAHANVWSRAWRRRKMRDSSSTNTTSADTPCVFAFAVAVRVGVAETTVTCRWREGHDDVIYESFCGFLRRALSNHS